MCERCGVTMASVECADGHDQWLEGEVDEGEFGTDAQAEGVTNLLYTPARYFDPGVGRWLDDEPAGFEKGDTNLYRYFNPGCASGPMPPELK
jgi:RHS repeat-associated protein